MSNTNKFDDFSDEIKKISEIKSCSTIDECLVGCSVYPDKYCDGYASEYQTNPHCKYLSKNNE